jgi:hypothetical protein
MARRTPVGGPLQEKHQNRAEFPVNNFSCFANAVYRPSAKLSVYLPRKYRIRGDRQHIIGYDKVPSRPGRSGVTESAGRDAALIQQTLGLRQAPAPGQAL